MTQVITVANTKGGSGKTTIAVNLAAALAARGRHVAVLDADRQRSAMKWISETEDPALGKVHVSEAVVEAAIEAATANTAAEILIIDSQGAMTKDLSMCLALADLVLVPCRPGHDDLDGTRTIRDFLAQSLVRHGVAESPDFWVVMNGANPRSSVAHHVYRELVEAGFDVFKRGLSQRVAVAEASVNRDSLLRASGDHRVELGELADRVERVLDRQGIAA